MLNFFEWRQLFIYYQNILLPLWCYNYVFLQ